MAFLLDTNIAIHIGDGNGAVAERTANLPGSKLLSVVTIVELQAGLVTQPRHSERRYAALGMMKSRFATLVLDDEIVSAYAAIIAAIGFSRPRILDRLIAATAIVYDLTLVTTNGPDFSNIPDLKLQIWPRPAQ